MGRGRGGRRIRRRRSSRSVQSVASDVTTVKPAGADNQLVFNNNGAFGAVTPVTFDDTDIKLHDALA